MVYDVENLSEDTPTGVCRGAFVDGKLLCDECYREITP
jgi:hypothetical protein